MSLRGIAKDTLQILDAGQYTAPSGRQVSLRADLDAAIQGTRAWTPAELDALLDTSPPPPGGPMRLEVEVTGERTQEAAFRLASQEGEARLVLLNFASARNVGGGFLKGARAQEEDLMRCSGLYACVDQPSASAYYEANRQQDSMLYTDHLIYSPGVPFFRLQNRDRLEEPYRCSVITAPAPNAGQALRRDPHAGPQIEEALRRRAGKVLALAQAHGHRSLLLGAWGCGVFMNDPAQVADAFARWLGSERFRGAFTRVVFAVFEPGDQDRKEAIFRRALSTNPAKP